MSPVEFIANGIEVFGNNLPKLILAILIYACIYAGYYSVRHDHSMSVALSEKMGEKTAQSIPHVFLIVLIMSFL